MLVISPSIHGATARSGASPNYRGFTITLRHTQTQDSSGRVISNTRKRLASIRSAGFEPTIPASERPQTHALDRAGTGTGYTGCPTHYRTSWLADRCSVSQQLGALQTHTTDTHYRHTLQTHTTDTFLFISHTMNVLLFKFRCNIFIGVRIIKEMPGSVASGTLCISVFGASQNGVKPL